MLTNVQYPKVGPGQLILLIRQQSICVSQNPTLMLKVI